MNNEPTTTQDIIDSRDIVEYISEQTDHIEELREDAEDDDEMVAMEIDSIEKEIAMWQDFIEEAEQYTGDKASDGFQCINENHFTQYAEELAEECGYIDRNKTMDWPFCHIDWEAAAEALKIDYTEIEIDGETFYVR